MQFASERGTHDTPKRIKLIALRVQMQLQDIFQCGFFRTASPESDFSGSAFLFPRSTRIRALHDLHVCFPACANNSDVCAEFICTSDWQVSFQIYEISATGFAFEKKGLIHCIFYLHFLYNIKSNDVLVSYEIQ
jgi:hypothetical protein